MKKQDKTYFFKNMRFYNIKEYDEFVALCHDKNSSFTREINVMISKAVDSKILPSEFK